MTEDDEKDFKNNDLCRFCEKNINSDKVRDLCHLTVKYRGPARSKCKINLTQDKSSIIPFIVHNYNNYDCHLFFTKVS